MRSLTRSTVYPTRWLIHYDAEFERSSRLLARHVRRRGHSRPRPRRPARSRADTAPTREKQGDLEMSVRIGGIAAIIVARALVAVTLCIGNGIVKSPSTENRDGRAGRRSRLAMLVSLGRRQRLRTLESQPAPGVVGFRASSDLHDRPASSVAVRSAAVDGAAGLRRPTRRTISRSGSSPTAPCPSTASWKARMSKRAPSRLTASARSRRISRWPIL